MLFSDSGMCPEPHEKTSVVQFCARTRRIQRKEDSPGYPFVFFGNFHKASAHCAFLQYLCGKKHRESVFLLKHKKYFIIISYKKNVAKLHKRERGWKYIITAQFFNILREIRELLYLAWFVHEERRAEQKSMKLFKQHTFFGGIHVPVLRLPLSPGRSRHQQEG